MMVIMDKEQKKNQRVLVLDKAATKDFLTSQPVAATKVLGRN